MFLVEIADRIDDSRRHETTAFVQSVAARIGRRPLSDHLWLDLLGGGADGFVGITVRDPNGIVGWAQVSAVHDGGSLEVVTTPDLDPTTARRVLDDAVRTAVDAVRRGGGGHLTWWSDDPDPALADLATGLGLAPGRALHEMRRDLPATEHATVATRSFRPGADDAEWVRVNNRAFADHAEQGGWTVDTLASRRREAWFDPDGFRIHEREGRIAAFCWTKLHHDHDPVMGEIYVIAVDPDFHGQGLGRQLTLAGLDSIAARGVTLADLWVDADNTAALSLYDRLGFSIHRTRRAFAGELDPSETP